MNALHESTPHKILEGCTSAERTWMSTREVGPVTFCRTWPSLVRFRVGGTAPMAAVKRGVADDVTLTLALHELPVLQGVPTRFPLSSKMPMLHGVLVKSALAVALIWTAPPTWKVELPPMAIESQVSARWSDTAQMSGLENFDVGRPTAATRERPPLDAWLKETLQFVPRLQYVTRFMLLRSKSSIA